MNTTQNFIIGHLLYLYITIGFFGLFFCTLAGFISTYMFAREEIKIAANYEKDTLRKKRNQDLWNLVRDFIRWFIWPYYAILMIITKGKNETFANMWFRAAFS